MALPVAHLHISRTIFPSKFEFDGIRFSVTPLYGILSLQNLAHTTAVQLSIIFVQLGWEQNEILVEFELRWKNHSWNGPLYTMYYTVIIIMMG